MSDFAPLIVQQGAQIAGASAESSAIRAEAEYRQQIAESNVALSNLSAEDAIRRGEEAAFIERRQTKQRIADQRVAAAGGGVVVDEGSAGEIVRSTQDLRDVNIMTLRTNAFRQAHGFRVEASEAESRRRFLGVTGRVGARTTLLTGGLQAARGILADTKVQSALKKL